jgi:hypothetical protein
VTVVVLPDKPQNVTSRKPSPMAARVSLIGLPKVGKSTLAAQWAPDTTLFVDLQHGTDLIPGDHYVQHCDDWIDFEKTCTALAAGGHRYRTVVIDTIDKAYKFADRHAAAKYGGKVAAGVVEFGKGTAEAEGLFRKAIDGLLGRRGMGIWFIGHAVIESINSVDKMIPKLDKRVRDYIAGEVEHILVAEKIGKRTVLHTTATARFEAGSRVNLPDPLEMDARKLYAALQAGIDQLAAPGESSTNGKAKS